ncbi:hypothetical protein HDV05_003328 [Chytridiales sp. JEL 0842]|nr:hypothetical protein HDV05_003328 [Chytridiales sp. JEL 0842]
MNGYQVQQQQQQQFWDMQQRMQQIQQLQHKTTVTVPSSTGFPTQQYPQKESYTSYPSYQQQQQQHHHHQAPLPPPPHQQQQQPAPTPFNPDLVKVATKILFRLLAHRWSSFAPPAPHHPPQDPQNPIIHAPVPTHASSTLGFPPRSTSLLMSSLNAAAAGGYTPPISPAFKRASSSAFSSRSNTPNLLNSDVMTPPFSPFTSNTTSSTPSPCPSLSADSTTSPSPALSKKPKRPAPCVPGLHTTTLHRLRHLLGRVVACYPTHATHLILYALLLIRRVLSTLPSSSSSSSDGASQADTGRQELPECLKSPDRLILGALMLAEAHLSDLQTSTAAWDVWMGGAHSGFSRVEVAKVKRELLGVLEYRTLIGKEEYRTLKFHL